MHIFMKSGSIYIKPFVCVESIHTGGKALHLIHLSCAYNLLK